MSLDPAAWRALEEVLRSAVADVRQLSGGASRQTYRIEVEGGGGYILQRELTDPPRLPNGMADEADLVTAARRAGVPAPTVVATNRDGGAELGASFFITEAVDGETIARRILREDRFAEARPALPAQLGRALGALHIGVDPATVAWLERTDEITRYRQMADELDLVSPAFELGFRWLDQHRPPRGPLTVVHGDFRLGNLIVDEQGLAAVIDWELGHLGDPMEDLGWLCVRAWRFGGPGPVAGVGRYEDLFEAYEEAAGTAVDPEVVRWWETLGTLKWGIMCGTQSDRHRSGAVRSVELAAIGPRVAEQEYDLCRLLAPTASVDEPPLDPVAVPRTGERATGGAEGGGRPSAAELVEAVREFLTGDVSEATEGRVNFHARVAANALAIVGRDLALAEAIYARHRHRLAGLGVESDRELADAIRSGALDHRFDEVASVALASATDRLAVNNPRWVVA